MARFGCISCLILEYLVHVETKVLQMQAEGTLDAYIGRLSQDACHASGRMTELHRRWFSLFSNRWPGHTYSHRTNVMLSNSPDLYESQIQSGRLDLPGFGADTAFACEQ